MRAIGSSTRSSGCAPRSDRRAASPAALGRALPFSVRGARALRHLASSPAQAYALKHAYGMFEADAKTRLYSGDFAAQVAGTDPLAAFRDAYGRCRSTDPIDRGLYVDVHTYMVDDILTKVDRMSMAVSLEARDPLLDHRLLEFAATVPSTLKLKDGRGKHLLRKVLETKVPRQILERGKQGFAAPIGEWLRGPLAPMAEELLADGRLRDRGLFNDREVGRLWTDHRDGRADHRHRLWQLIMLELWFRQFIDRAPAMRTPYAEAI